MTVVAKDCIVCVHVLRDKAAVLYVGYGPDLDWQFHCNCYEHNAYNIFPIHFRHVYELDCRLEAVIRVLLERGPGFGAVRESESSDWTYERIDEAED